MYLQDISKRQYDENIHYIGNAFTITQMQETMTEDICIEWDKEPVYVN